MLVLQILAGILFLKTRVGEAGTWEIWFCLESMMRWLWYHVLTEYTPLDL